MQTATSNRVNAFIATPEVRWAVIYGICAGLWIVFSDQVLLFIVRDIETLTNLQTAKGIFFVTITGIYLFVIVRSNRLVNERHIEQLQKSEARQQMLFHSNPQPMWVYDPATMAFWDVNNAAVKAYGYSRDEFLSMTLKDIRPGEDIALLEANIEQARPLLQDSGEWRHITKSGFQKDVHIISHMIQHEGRDAVLVTAYDITEQKKLRNHLNEQKQLSMALEQQLKNQNIRRQFISEMSHQFRTPMTTINTSVGLLATYHYHGDTPKLMEHKERIEIQVKRLNEMLDEVMEMFEVEDLKVNYAPKNLKVQDYLKETIHQNYPTERVHLNTNIPDAIIFADPKLLYHALDNLISNGMKYSREDQPVQVETEQNDRDVVIAVRDYGIGIPPDDLPYLFEQFYRGNNVRKIPGNGLGLAIAAQVVKLHNGNINVKSEVGAGTTFTVRLPLAK